MQGSPSFGRNLTLGLWRCIERNKLKIALGNPSTPSFNIVPTPMGVTEFCGLMLGRKEVSRSKLSLWALGVSRLG